MNGNASPLWQALERTSRSALAKRALRPIPTRFDFVEQEGARFLVRVMANLARKDKARKAQEAKGKDYNPFLPYEQDLFVGDLSPTHVGLINKFNVVDHHLLILTRDFEDQDRLLNLADFEALWVCLAQINGLTFYNGGKDAGASQRHKHLQLVPLPLTPEGPAVPMEALLSGDDGKADLPFPNAFVRMGPGCKHKPEQSAVTMYAAYRSAMAWLGLWGTDGTQAGAYNLIATREWLLLVPRARERYQGIAVNALGFAGTFLVRNEEQLQLLRQIGPLNLLARVSTSSHRGDEAPVGG